MLLRNLSFLVAGLGIAAAASLIVQSNRHTPDPPPVSTPARSPYENTVAATGLVESSRENVKIAAPRAGLVTRVHGRVGDRVKAGTALFQLDDREVRARIAAMEAQLAAARAQLAVDENSVADWSDQVARYERLERDRVATEDELKRRQFAVTGARARADATRAQIALTEAQLGQARTDLEILTVRAPRDGQLLQVNVREGEFAPAAALGEPLMMLGDVDRLQIRCEVDEQNALLVSTDQPAVASLKGHAHLKMPLRFVRVEPFVVPKRSLTGDSLERVDTRVLQVVYEFDRPTFPVYVGQQVDVFIARPPVSPAPAAPTNSPTAVR